MKVPGLVGNAMDKASCSIQGVMCMMDSGLQVLEMVGALSRYGLW